MIYTPLQLHRSLYQRCFINGQPYILEGQAAISRDIYDMQATCSLILADIPATNIEYTSVTVDIKWYDKWERVFTGVALPKALSEPTIQRSVEATDILYLLDTSPTEPIEWSNTPYLTAIRNLLDAARVPSSLISLPTTTDLVSRAIIAQNEIITIDSKDNIQQVMKELLAFGRYRLFVDRNGIVRLRKFSTTPTRSASIKFSSLNVADNQYGFSSIKNEIGKSERICNRFRVDGKISGAREQPWAAWKTDDAVGNGESMNSRFCQSEEQCAELATDEGRDRCRYELYWNIQMPPDPMLEPGQCIEVKSDLVGISEFLPGRIIRQRYDGTNMELTVSYNPRAIGGLDDGGGEEHGRDPLEEDGYDPFAKPQASFTSFVDREALVYGLILDGSASWSDGGEITEYEWSVEGAAEYDPRPSFTSDPQQSVILDSIEGVTVTLTVTDELGATDSVTKSLELDKDAYYTRALQAIVDYKWFVLLDWDQGWVEKTPPGLQAIKVAHRSETPFMFCAMGDSSIWRYDTRDFWGDPVQVAPPKDNVVLALSQGEVWANPECGNVVMYSCNKQLFVSFDALSDAPTWTGYELPAAIRDVAINPFLPTSLMICMGNGYYASHDGGQTWDIVEEGTDDSYALKSASFPWDAHHAVIFGNTNTYGELMMPYPDLDWDALLGEDFDTLDLAAITPGLEEEYLLVAARLNMTGFEEQEDALVIVEGGTLTKLELEGLEPGWNYHDIQAIERDGMLNDVVWIADTGIGATKLVGKKQVLSLDLEGLGLDIGYGNIQIVDFEIPPEPTPPYIYLVPVTQSGANDVIWRYNLNRGGWDSLVLPVEGKQWDKVVVSPWDSKKIIIAYFSLSNPNDCGAYYSEDGGTNWHLLKFSEDQTTERTPYAHNMSPWNNILFNEELVYFSMNSVSGGNYAKPYWGKIVLPTEEDEGNLTLDFKTTGYEVYHWSNTSIPNYSSDYFGEDGEIFRFVNRNAASLINPGSRHFMGTLSGDNISWSQNYYYWSDGTSIYYKPKDSIMYKVGNNYMYAVLRAPYDEILFKPVPEVPLTGGATAYSGSGRYWGHGICLFQDKVFSIRNIYISGSQYWMPGVRSFLQSSAPTIGDAALIPNEYEADELDVMGRNIVANDRWIATMNKTQNHIIFYDSEEEAWGTLPFPGGVTSEMVSSFIGIGDSGA